MTKSNEAEAVDLLVGLGLGRVETRRWCRTCGEFVGKCSRDKKCKRPDWTAQSRFVFETDWAAVPWPWDRP